MPSVDDLLRQAFEPTDDEWVRRAPAAHAHVVARHRRRQVVRRSSAAAAVVATVVAAVAIVVTDSRPRATEPTAPSPTTSTTGIAPTATTPLEGTWTSARLGIADVLAAARAAGAPRTAGLMLEQLPGVPFRVVVEVRGANLTTTLTTRGAGDEVMDREALSVTGRRVDVRPFGGVGARTVHTWVLDGDRLTLSFVSSTEPVTDGVPGEAWHRLLYDSAAFTR